MLREFLILYVKKNIKRILGYLIVNNFILMLGILTDQWVIIGSLISILLILYYINLEIKQFKICVIYDTHHQQELFYSDLNISALKNNKFTKSYKKWLLRNAINSNAEINYKFSVAQNVNDFCFFCCINVLIMMIISALLLIYITFFSVLLTTIIFITFVIITYAFLQKRVIRERYRKLDSEIKRAIFEEETGYSPLIKEKFSFKYRAWLIMNERDQVKSVFVNND